jgi:uncharacterized protein (DUF2141 family)
MKVILFAIAFSLLPQYCFVQPNPGLMEKNTLTVEVHSLRNEKGTVRLTLFNSADGFPTEVSKAFRKANGKARNGKCTLVLEDMPPGEYAISLLHDENDNEKMDTRLMGIPKEGYGASNDARVTFGPPKFADARFPLTQNQTTVRIKMRYM